tara:strand:- start:219 stop:419 length:201 start_codon:yes stop_codon:yes gene_type:complete
MKVRELIDKLSCFQGETEILDSNANEVIFKTFMFREKDNKRRIVGIYLKEELDPEIERLLDNSDLD